MLTCTASGASTEGLVCVDLNFPCVSQQGRGLSPQAPVGVPCSHRVSSELDFYLLVSC